MSERQPLLQNDSAEESSSIRKMVAEMLESNAFHKFVIALITIDASCVLADLTYTLLSPSCEPVGSESPVWLDILQEVSRVITSAFLLEIPLAIWTLGLQFYNPFGSVPHAGLHLFDASIIVATFVLETVLQGRERELAGLLIVLRLWRLVKLVGGIAVGAGELGEENAKALAETEEELEKTKAQLAATQDQIQRLQARLAELGESTT